MEVISIGLNPILIGGGVARWAYRGYGAAGSVGSVGFTGSRYGLWLLEGELYPDVVLGVFGAGGLT